MESDHGDSHSSLSCLGRRSQGGSMQNNAEIHIHGRIQYRAFRGRRLLAAVGWGGGVREELSHFLRDKPPRSTKQTQIIN